MQAARFSVGKEALGIRCGRKMNFIMQYDSPLGTLTGVSDGARLAGLWFDRKFEKSGSDFTAVERGDSGDRILNQTADWLDRYFGGAKPAVDVPVLPAGTPFQMEVWRILMTIPYGKTVSYGAIAKQIAARRGMAAMSAQAVGNAVGRNPISIIVPCHRVIGSDGSLTGFTSGLWRKTFLLSLEGILPNG